MIKTILVGHTFEIPQVQVREDLQGDKNVNNQSSGETSIID